jgi:ABC-2 type transport system permease protein
VNNPFRFFIRLFSFLSKEIVEILRQPRLIFTLILGPFLILLLFGIGYRNEGQPLRTLFVVPDGSALREAIEQQVTSMGPQLLFAGITNSEAEGRRRLQENEVDVVAIVPPDAYGLIRNSQQAVFTLLHNELDPFQADYIRVFGRIYADEVNRRVLQAITQEGQRDASTLTEVLRSSRENAEQMRQALERGDRALAAARAGDLRQDVNQIDLLVGGSVALLGGVQQVVGSEQPANSEVPALVAGLRQETQALDLSPDNPSADLQARFSAVEEQLALLEAELAEFQQIDSTVLITPFASETQSIAPVQLRVVDYYAPSVIILLLQHFAVTFAGLSIVREQRSGIMELFRVAPISAMETLLGKYMSYLIFIGAIAAVLTALLFFGLRVPVLGDWTQYALVLLALVFTALGVGFVFSLLAETTSQAVQYAMILLLTSIFFSGFFLSLDMLWAPVRIVSWLLPATYGIRLLQNVMLRGIIADWGLLINLAAFGLCFLLVAWILLHVRMARR